MAYLDTPDATLEAVILDDLMRLFGPLLHGRALRQSLGYASDAALRQIIARGTTPVTLFKLEGRRGRYALTRLVARWLASQALPNDTNQRAQAG